jgi:predicted membrane protein
LLQQKLVFHEQLCNIVNIFKMKAVVKLLFKWFFFWEIFFLCFLSFGSIYCCI